MSKPGSYRDFTKDFDNLGKNNFPTTDKKSKNLENSFKFKFASKAQKGASFDSTITTVDGDKQRTDAEFGAKISFQDLEGVELSLKTKNKPSFELSAKLDDKIFPVENGSLTLKVTGEAPATQNFELSFGYANNIVNGNLSYNHPINQKLFAFVDGPKDENSANPLDDQNRKVHLDAVVKPLEDKNVFVGANADITLPGKQALQYSGTLKVALKEDKFVGGVEVNNSLAYKEVKGEGDKTTVVEEKKTSFGAFAYSEVDDVSGGAKVTYALGKDSETYKGFGFEASAGIKRDADSNLSTKVQVIPDTTLSLGYDQKLNSNVKLSFGYAFLLAKADAKQGDKSRASAYQFGIEFSH